MVLIRTTHKITFTILATDQISNHFGAVMREGKAKVLSKSEFTQLLHIVAAGPHAERNIAIIMMGFGLGLRVGEIATLQIEDVLNEDNSLRDHFQIKRINSKTNQNRDVYLSNPKVRRALRAYIDYRRNNDPVVMVPTSPLFRSQKGSGFTPNSMQQLLKRLYRRAGLPDTVKSHSARRSFATKLLANGVDIKSVSLLMGHANITQTADYVESNPHVLRAAVIHAI